MLDCSTTVVQLDQRHWNDQERRTQLSEHKVLAGESLIAFHRRSAGFTFNNRLLEEKELSCC